MILMPPMCGIFFLKEGDDAGSNTVDPHAEE